MKRYLLIGGLVVMVGLLVSADVYARGKGRCGCMGSRGPGVGPAAAANLDLDENQQKKLSELREEHARSIATIRDELDARRAELQELWSAERPDRGAILAKHAEMDLLRRKLREARVDHRLAVQDILTSDQRARLLKLLGQGPAGGCPGMGHCPCGMDCHGCGMGPGAGCGKRLRGVGR